MLQVQYYPGNRIRNNIPHKHDEKLIELDDEGRVLDVISQPGQPDIIKCIWFIEQYPFFAFSDRLSTEIRHK